LFIDLLVQAGIFKDTLPVYHTIWLWGLAEAENLWVHLLVSGEHTDKVPNILRSFVVAIKEIEERIELVLVCWKSISWHLVYVKGNFFDNLTHFLEVKSDIMIFQVRLDSLKRRANSGVIVKSEEVREIDASVLIDIVLRKNLFDTLIFF
jgi:hypothetical protein